MEDRAEQRSEPVPQCFRCQASILDGDLVLREHGDWYHVRCIGAPRADRQAPERSKLKRISGSVIAPSRERRAPAAVLAGSCSISDPSEKSPVVLCAICRKGITSAELMMTDGEALHVGCHAAAT